MKTFLFAVFSVLVSIAALPPVRCPAATLVPGATEVVIEPDAPKTVRFAAEEMTNFLGRVFGAAVSVANAPAKGKISIFLGDSKRARAAGIDVSSMERDAFSIVAGKDGVFIAGRDDPEADTRRAIYADDTGVWAQLHEHATLFGVYEFLERYAGVRMYFPGELGEIVPQKTEIEVPDGRTDVKPDFLERNYSAFGDGVWYEGEDREKHLIPGRKLNYVRNRMQTLFVPCCHGSRYFYIQKRFAKTHPEYMALLKRGKELVRDTDPSPKYGHPGQLCHSSDVYDVFFDDIMAYERGDDPEPRGLGKRWHISAFRRPWVDIMPQDGYEDCQCEKCQAAYDRSMRHYATKLVWGRTVELARRLKEAGSGMRITQMAYTPYRSVPDIDIPDNVDVMVAEPGPWYLSNPAQTQSEYAEVRAWHEKLGRKVWMWIYPNKYGSRELPGIPNGTPRAWAAYIRGIAPHIFGVYAESENDRALYNSLCYYVLGKVCWNANVDVEALLDEYFRLMFGAGAEPMARFFAEIEEKWVREVSGNLVETPLGPESQTPGPYALFAEIYSPEVVGRWRGYLDAASSAVTAGSLESRRVALFRREFFDPLEKAAGEYLESISVEGELARRASGATRNLLVNGDLSAPPPVRPGRHYGYWTDAPRRDWRGGWIATEPSKANVELSDDVPPGVEGRSLRLFSHDAPRTVQVENHFVPFTGKYKPGAKYRISFFVKLDNVVSAGKGGGMGVRVWHDRNEWFPKNRLTGTTGWMHQEYFFTAGVKSDDFSSTFSLYLWNATGSIEFAGLRIEELPPE